MYTCDDPIQIIDHNPQWSVVFKELSSIISKELGCIAIGIEHVGSTSVAGLAAKPVIDLDVIIESKKDLPQVIKRLATLGYFHQGDLGIEGRESFSRVCNDVPWGDVKTVRQEHNLYVCTKDCEELKRHIMFRDYLRENSDTAVLYGKLKKKLAKKYGDDRKSYTDAKIGFITNVLSRLI